jgi:hypothetical protein
MCLLNVGQEQWPDGAIPPSATPETGLARSDAQTTAPCPRRNRISRDSEQLDDGETPSGNDLFIASLRSRRLLPGPSRGERIGDLARGAQPRCLWRPRSAPLFGVSPKCRSGPPITCVQKQRPWANRRARIGASRVPRRNDSVPSGCRICAPVRGPENLVRCARAIGPDQVTGARSRAWRLRSPRCSAAGSRSCANRPSPRRPKSRPLKVIGPRRRRSPFPLSVTDRRGGTVAKCTRSRPR